MNNLMTPMKPRLAYILKMYPRFSETFIVSELLALERAGFQIDIFSLRAPVDGRFHRFLSDVGASVTYIESHPTRISRFWNAMHALRPSTPALWATLKNNSQQDAEDVYQALLVAAHVQERGIEHIHAHFGSVATFVAQLTAQICGIRFSFTMHAKDIYHESVDANALSDAIKAASFSITVSDYNHQYLEEVMGIRSESLHRIYNGLDLSLFPFTPIKARENKIVAVGRLVEKKGFDYLIQASFELRKRGLEIPCQIIGAGPLEEHLKELINRHRVADLVTILGPRTQDEVIHAVSSASVFIAPCVVAEDGNRDGLPTVLLEAMALGTPCISTDVTAIPEIIDHLKTGLIVPQRDSLTLADSIESLVGNQHLQQEIAINARCLIETCFDIDKNIKQLSALFVRHSSRRSVVHGDS